ncbi:MAG: glycosyltransferase [Steroidobacteraceae bacterium]
MTLSIALFIAGAALAVLVIGWILYPLASVAAGRRHKPARESTRTDDPVAIVLATREAPGLVAEQVVSLAAQDYPAERVDLIVAVDATSRYELSEYLQAVGDRARVVQGDAPGGKACTLNAGVRAARAEYVVFADTQPRFLERSVAALVGFLHANPQFGGVSGALDLNSSSTERDTVLGPLWNFEIAVRRAHANLHSICAVTGAIYAIRRALWSPLPDGAICDDLFVPMHIIMSGQRVGFCETARALDARRFTRPQEFQRKVRTLTGMLQFVSMRPAVLLPWRNPVWSQFVFHKLLRIATPFLAAIFAVGASGALYAAGVFAFWPFAFVPLVLLLLPAAAGSGRTRKLLGDLGWVLLLLCAPVVAVWRALRGRWDVWRPQLQGSEPH